MKHTYIPRHLMTKEQKFEDWKRQLERQYELIYEAEQQYLREDGWDPHYMDWGIDWQYTDVVKITKVDGNHIEYIKLDKRFKNKVFTHEYVQSKWSIYEHEKQHNFKVGDVWTVHTHNMAIVAAHDNDCALAEARKVKAAAMREWAKM